MEGNLGAAPVVAAKVKKPMSQAEIDRNERRKAAFEELRKLNPKAKWTDASKLVSFRNKGEKGKENAFMEAIVNPAEAAGNAAAAQAVANNRPVAPAVVEAQNAVINEAAGAAAAVERKFTRNNAKRSLERVMAKYNLKPSGSLIQKMLGLHRRGENNAPFLQELNQKTAAAAVKKASKTVKKATKAPGVLTQSAWQEIKAQVNRNVLASGMKVNGINRRALTTARKNRPNLSVANFMRNKAPRVRKTKIANKVNKVNNIAKVPTQKQQNRKAVFDQAKINATSSGLRFRAPNLQSFTSARMLNPNLVPHNFLRSGQLPVGEKVLEIPEFNDDY